MMTTAFPKAFRRWWLARHRVYVGKLETVELESIVLGLWLRRLIAAQEGR